MYSRFTPGRQCCGVCRTGCGCSEGSIQICLTISDWADLGPNCLTSVLNTSWTLTIPFDGYPVSQYCYRLGDTSGFTQGVPFAIIPCDLGAGPASVVLFIQVTIGKPVAGVAEMYVRIWQFAGFGEFFPVLLGRLLLDVPLDCASAGPFEMEMLEPDPPNGIPYPRLSVQFGDAYCYSYGGGEPEDNCCFDFERPPTLLVTWDCGSGEQSEVFTYVGEEADGGYTYSFNTETGEFFVRCFVNAVTGASGLFFFGTGLPTVPLTILSCDPFHATGTAGACIVEALG